MILQMPGENQKKQKKKNKKKVRGREADKIFSLIVRCFMVSDPRLHALVSN